MKIMRIKFICPKCKKEYMNEFLAGYHSMFADAARTFEKNNVTKVYCDNCNEKLIDENLLKYFNNSGEYSPKTEYYELTEEIDEFKIYLDVLREIRNFFLCVSDGEAGIISKMDKTEKYVNANIIVKGKAQEKEYELLKINVFNYEYDIGDRKNAFIIKMFEKMIDAVASGVYEYLFEDDCSPYYNKKKESKIYYKAM